MYYLQTTATDDRSVWELSVWVFRARYNIAEGERREAEGDEKKKGWKKFPIGKGKEEKGGLNMMSYNSAVRLGYVSGLNLNTNHTALIILGVVPMQLCKFYAVMKRKVYFEDRGGTGARTKRQKCKK